MQPHSRALSLCTACNNRHITTDGHAWRCEYHLVLFPTAGRHSRACLLHPRITLHNFSPHAIRASLPTTWHASFHHLSRCLLLPAPHPPAAQSQSQYSRLPGGGCLADPPGVPVLVGARTLSSPPLRVYRLEGDVYISRLARPLHLPGWRSRYISRLARPLHLEGDEADLADARGGEADHRGDEGQARPEGRQVDLPRHQRQVEPAEGED